MREGSTEIPLKLNLVQNRHVRRSSVVWSLFRYYDDPDYTYYYRSKAPRNKYQKSQRLAIFFPNGTLLPEKQQTHHQKKVIFFPTNFVLGYVTGKRFCWGTFQTLKLGYVSPQTFLLGYVPNFEVRVR